MRVCYIPLGICFAIKRFHSESGSGFGSDDELAFQHLLPCVVWLQVVASVETADYANGPRCLPTGDNPRRRSY